MTSKTILLGVAIFSLGGSAVYWWGIQSSLYPGNKIITLAFTALMVLAPPALVSFLIPWSPGGMLLQKVNARTWGYVVVVGCSVFLLYYSFQISWAWQSAQQVVAESDLIYQQVVISMIGFIIIPALLFAPVSADELVEQVRQQHIVKRYELQTQADIAILRATLLRAQEKALIGFANLTVEEREELAAVMRSLVTGIEGTLHEVGASVKAVSGVALPFDMLEDNEDIRDVLGYIGESLTSTSLSVREETGQTKPVSHQPRGNRRPTIRFRHPGTGKVLEAPVIDRDPFGHYIVETPRGDRKKVDKKYVIEEE